MIMRWISLAPSTTRSMRTKRQMRSTGPSVRTPIPPKTWIARSETRYARNGDLRVAYRASREGPRDIVFVPNWFTNCELAPELPSIQGWVEAMTSLGRLIFFDQLGYGSG